MVGGVDGNNNDNNNNNKLGATWQDENISKPGAAGADPEKKRVEDATELRGGQTDWYTGKGGQELFSRTQ